METHLTQKVRVHRGRCGCAVDMRREEDGWWCPLCQAILNEAETLLVSGPEHTMMYGLRRDGSLFPLYFVSSMDLPIIESEDRPLKKVTVTDLP